MTDAPTPDTDRPRRVHITAEAGRARIVVDGVDLARGVRGYNLQHSVDDMLPTLLLDTRQPDGVEWEGLARVAVAGPQDPGEVIAGFLARVDAAALERAALNRDDLGNGKHDLTRAMLRQLTEWATGGGT